jgi:hypothetical protein
MYTHLGVYIQMYTLLGVYIHMVCLPTQLLPQSCLRKLQNNMFKPCLERFMHHLHFPHILQCKMYLARRLLLRPPPPHITLLARVGGAGQVVHKLFRGSWFFPPLFWLRNIILGGGGRAIE